MSALLSRKEYKALEPVKRLEILLADGMWWSVEKLAKLSFNTEDMVVNHLETLLADGSILQAETGSKSYRMPYDSILSWYEREKYAIDQQLIDNLFAPRLWDGMTEVEGFETAPIREIGSVKFSCDSKVAQEVKMSLRGIGKVRALGDGQYKASGLNMETMRKIIVDVLEANGVPTEANVLTRFISYRRELVDFSPNFLLPMVEFYKDFAAILLRSHMETISIYIPNREDQESQFVQWVISVIEKYDEKSTVPFSGYLHSVLRFWPYDLPEQFLGKELASFQRERSKIVKSLKEKHGHEYAPTLEELADLMDMPYDKFLDLDEQNRNWLRDRNADTLEWSVSNDEKISTSINAQTGNPHESMMKASLITLSAVEAGLETGDYMSTLAVIDTIDSVFDENGTGITSEVYLKAFAEKLGIS